MARPTKDGVDYFPLDVDIDQDDKVAIIEAQYGITAFGIVIKLLMHIYKNGYFYEWTEREQILFSKRVNVDINEVNAIINDCVKWGMFNERLFETYQILTSRGVQKRYFEITKRRLEVKVDKRYLLLDDADINPYTNIVYVDINPHTNRVNADIGTQSKVKESKAKDSKESIVEADASTSENEVKTVESKEPRPQFDEGFETLWKEYPRKSGKQVAYKSYKKALKEGAATCESIMQGIKAYKKQIEAKKTEPQFIAMGSTWFNQRRWEDDYDFTPVQQPRQTGKTPSSVGNFNLGSVQEEQWKDFIDNRF